MLEITESEIIKKLKEQISKDYILTIDFGYTNFAIEKWWQNQDKNKSFHLLKLSLISVIISNLKQEDLNNCEKLGKNNIVGVCITNLFKKDDEKLSLLVHEALSDLFRLQDINYEYEEHKALYLKLSGVSYSEWGNGSGEISPHSDDLYEDTDTNFLSLTTCRDETKTPTSVLFPRDLLKDFSDNELYILLNMQVKFISGKNVAIQKTKQRKLIEYCNDEGFHFAFDFRIDNDNGPRMVAVDPKNNYLIDKMRKNISKSTPIKSMALTGTFLIIVNAKVMHARKQLNINKNFFKLYSESSISNAPRLFFRSKGPKILYPQCEKLIA